MADPASDPFEALYARGVTDGLPVVPPTRERVKGIIWLNPEGQWGWGIGDSVMPLYAPACDIVKECRTVGQLVQVVDQLVHQWWRRGH